jgi:hypothetical protein
LSVFISCKKSSEVIVSAEISDYAPLVVGKYITYKLDSLVFVNFNSTSAVRTYEVKYAVEAQITDNLNRPAFRIVRYIRKTAANTFLPDATFLATNTGNGFEFVENNMRFIKLLQPIRDGFTWKGNVYIDTYSINSDFRYLDDWDYTYSGVGAVENGVETIVVEQQDEVIGNPSDLTGYHEINQGVEKYAKGIGLVYKLFLHTEYQPPIPGRGGFYQGYGITLNMIDHN